MVFKACLSPGFSNSHQVSSICVRFRARSITLVSIVSENVFQEVRLGLQVWPRGSLGVDMGVLGVYGGSKVASLCGSKATLPESQKLCSRAGESSLFAREAASESVSFAIHIQRHCLELTSA